MSTSSPFFVLTKWAKADEPNTFGGLERQVLVDLNEVAYIEDMADKTTVVMKDGTTHDVKQCVSEIAKKIAAAKNNWT